MSDAGDRLREGLAARGVEYSTIDGKHKNTLWQVGKLDWWYDVDTETGKTVLFTPKQYDVTPEQAIAATLGGGKLTAEQVRKCVRVGACDHGLWGALDEDTDWQAIAEELNATLGTEINGETSDGYHTFNELYHHRAVLFSVIVANNRGMAWKAKKHHDGTMYDGMFIVGLDTPWGQASYHYDIDPYWDMFDCEERESAPEWDGHTPDEAIERIGKLATLTHSTTDSSVSDALGGGECEVKWHDIEYNGEADEWTCLSCGERWMQETDCPAACPWCGKAVKR